MPAVLAAPGGNESGSEVQKPEDVQLVLQMPSGDLGHCMLLSKSDDVVFQSPPDVRGILRSRMRPFEAFSVVIDFYSRTFEMEHIIEVAPKVTHLAS